MRDMIFSRAAEVEERLLLGGEGVEGESRVVAVAAAATLYTSQTRVNDQHVREETAYHPSLRLE